MKKTILLCIVVAIASYIAGVETTKVSQEEAQFLIGANSFKKELLEHQARALNLADSLMDSHNLWDADGGDTMCAYLEECYLIDSLYSVEL